MQDKEDFHLFIQNTLLVITLLALLFLTRCNKQDPWQEVSKQKMPQPAGKVIASGHTHA